jgi:two-component system LytT family sensor kinase
MQAARNWQWKNWRYSLSQGKTEKVPLSQEIAVLGRYLALEKIRFEEKISVSIEVQSRANDIRVPPFLLHPLLENAVKYGMQTSPMPLQIQLTAIQDGDSLRLAVANTGRWVSAEESILNVSRGGHGLQIVQQRLEQEYPSEHRFESRENNGWVENVIVIPLSGLEAARCR